MIWSKKRDPMRDPSRPATVCRDPDLHVEWPRRVLVVSMLAFGLGALLQRWFHFLP